MKYRSTRDVDSPPVKVDFRAAVMAGLAADGGLFIPDGDEPLSQLLPATFLDDWADFSFQDIATHLFPPFINSRDGPAIIPANDLKELVQKSFSRFSHPEVTPVVRIGESDEKVFLLELYHGPTLAFKDVALQFLGNLFDYFLRNADGGGGQSSSMTILGATSGDTGGAAIESVRSKELINAFILHPTGRISPIQRAQMTSVLDSNIFNIAVDGTFDDCQRIVKEIFRDSEWKSGNGINLGAVNSINWARILAQIVYYFYAFFSLKKRLLNDPEFSEEVKSKFRVRFSVPTGNFGDVLAGYYARRLGLPIDVLMIATNKNDILDRFFRTGIYAKHEVHKTISPAMDIQVSSNFERWLWHFVYDSITPPKGSESKQMSSTLRQQLASECVLNWMKNLQTEGSFSTIDDLPTHLETQFAFTDDMIEAATLHFQSFSVDDTATMLTIEKYANPSKVKYPIVLCPHTAVGVRAVEQEPFEGFNVCLATAHPVKFVSAVADAVAGVTMYVQTKNNIDTERAILNGAKGIPGMTIPPQMKGLLDREQRCTDLSQTKEAVETFIVETLRSQSK